MTGPSDSSVQVEADCPCIGWCREYGVGAAGERHHRDCKRWSIELGTAYLTKRELIVVGTPESDDESHNCDAMGCSSVSHVVYRAALPVAALSDAEILQVADKYAQRWRSPDEEGMNFEKSAFFDFARALLRHSEGK